jgi:hypothetical protein
MSLQAGTQPRDVPVFMPMTLEIDWLNIDRRTLFLLTADGRIERENDPDHSPGPRFWLARCQEGNVFGIRADFPDDGAAELEAIAPTEPSFTLSVTPPRHLDRYAALVARACGVARRTFGLIYELPHSPRYESHAQLIGSDSEEGQRLGSPCPSAECPGAYRSSVFAALRICGHHGVPPSSMGRSLRLLLLRASRMWGRSLVL